jgi:hypothetical protein
MNAYHLLLTTDRFNLSKVQPNFINPCCFGEDFAAWLKGRLGERGIEVSGPGQEDWGWYLKARSGGASYFLAISGNSDDGAINRGEWRVIFVKRRSVWDRITKKGKIVSDDKVLKVLEEILLGQPDFQHVRRVTE